MTPSPTERILRLAAYLDEHRRDDVTLSDISRDLDGYEGDGARAPRDERGRLVEHTTEWEAIRKKVKRDLDDLREQWGIDGVYDASTHTYRLAPSFLTPAQRRALVSAAAVVSVEGIRVDQPGAIGSAVDDGFAAVVVQVHASVGVLRDAISTATPVRFRHEGRDRVLEPWALGVWRNKWYVAGGDPAHDGAMRRFRLDRIEPGAGGEAIELAGEPHAYVVADWFDVERAFDFDPNSWGSDPPVDVRVRVKADHVDAFEAEFGGAVTGTSAENAVVGVTVRHYESFRNRLFGFRGHAVVVTPPEMVDLVRSHLAAIAHGAREAGA